MLLNEKFYNSTRKSALQCNCDVCGKPTALFYGYICDFKAISKNRFTVLYMNECCFILCSEQCLKDWVFKNSGLLNSECLYPIIEDGQLKLNDNDNKIGDDAI